MVIGDLLEPPKVGRLVTERGAPSPAMPSV